jgi:hypothetical protein
MFPSTQPMNAPELRRDVPHPPRVVRVDPPPPLHDPLHTTLSSLTPSLLQDLMRFELEPGGQRRELLEVLAACVRHTQPLAIKLAWQQHVLTLSVFPLDRLVHCPMPMAELLACNLAALRVLLVQPAALRPAGHPERARVGQPAHYAPLGPLLWAVALRGARAALLPELAGHAAYRVAPGISWAGLDVPGAMGDCINRLRRQTSNLREIADWQGVGTERAMRLLNALYLQSGLIVSRTHPAATNEGWGGYK